MKWNSGSSIMPARPVPPEQFRAQATGVGNTRSRSYVTGMARAQRVSDCMSPKTRAQVPAAEGYPAPMPEMGY